MPPSFETRGSSYSSRFYLSKESCLSISWKIYFRIIKTLWRVDRKWTNVFNDLDNLIICNHWDSELSPILTSHGFVQIDKEFQTVETSAIISAYKDE